jgi:hypothetical protein
VPESCRRCGGLVRPDESQPIRHQVWEIPPIQPTVIECQLQRGHCAQAAAARPWPNAQAECYEGNVVRDWPHLQAPHGARLLRWRRSVDTCRRVPHRFST